MSTTDANGLIDFGGIKAGSYWLVEAQASIGYQPDPDHHHQPSSPVLR